MRILFDQNLSPTLKSLLQDLYPQSLHMQDIGMSSAYDLDVWEYAKEHAVGAGRRRRGGRAIAE